MNNSNDIINTVKKWMGLILYLSVILEIMLFPTWPNFCGCLMSLICWMIFSTFFLKRDIILEHPFAFTMFLSMFLYRYLPLIATLTEGKPITYGFELPFQTFFYETLLFIVSSLSFYFACVIAKKRNNIIQKTLYSLGFFECNVKMLWVLGCIGVVARLYTFSQGKIEFGDIAGKTALGFTYLMCAPLCLLFPTLWKKNAVSKVNQIMIWIYVPFIFLLSFAKNSRYSMIEPIATLILLFLLRALKDNVALNKIISPIKVIVLAFFLIFGINFLSDFSLAMLENRRIRGDIDRKELFERTIETYQNKELMSVLRSVPSIDQGELLSYADGWNEAYLDNFMLNRYGNMRITDQTLYYADKIGYSNSKMQRNFFDSWILKVFPTPFLRTIGINIDKSQYEYSPGDCLYTLATSGRTGYGYYRVTSHVGDGLATFGYWYFPIQFLLFFLVFKLLDCLVFYGKTVNYSIYGLLNIFFFMGMFRNAAGCGADLGFIIRGFWQEIFVYWIVLVMMNLLLIRRNRRNV